jgi:hypothetical protein
MQWLAGLPMQKWRSCLRTVIDAIVRVADEYTVGSIEDFHSSGDSFAPADTLVTVAGSALGMHGVHWCTVGPEVQLWCKVCGHWSPRVSPLHMCFSQLGCPCYGCVRSNTAHVRCLLVVVMETSDGYLN